MKNTQLIAGILIIGTIMFAGCKKETKSPPVVKHDTTGTNLHDTTVIIHDTTAIKDSTPDQLPANTLEVTINNNLRVFNMERFVNYTPNDFLYVGAVGPQGALFFVFFRMRNVAITTGTYRSNDSTSNIGVLVGYPTAYPGTTDEGFVFSLQQDEDPVTVTVTKITDSVIQGTFHGMVPASATQAGITEHLTKGKFNINLY